jgi:WD40 repeat protein
MDHNTVFQARGEVLSVAIAPDGTRLASASDDGTLGCPEHRSICVASLS